MAGGLPYNAAPYHGEGGGYLAQLLGRDGEDVPAGDGVIRQVSRGDAAPDRLLPGAPGRPGGGGGEGLGEGKALVGVPAPGGPALIVCPGDAAVEVAKGIHVLDGAVRTGGKGDAGIHHGAPGVAAAPQGLPHPQVRHVEVVLQKDRLGQHLHPQLPDAPELVGAGDLAMNDAVAGGAVRAEGLGPLDGV